MIAAASLCSSLTCAQLPAGLDDQTVTLRIRPSPGGVAAHIGDVKDGSVIGIELLAPSRNGVAIEGLPYATDVERVMRARGFRILQPAS